MKRYDGKSVYIAGKISGDRKYKIKFKLVEMKLKTMGFETVINPCNTPEPKHIKGEKNKWNYYMRYGISFMLTCDYVYALKDWDKSKGASLELGIARELGIKVIYD